MQCSFGRFHNWLIYVISLFSIPYGRGGVTKHFQPLVLKKNKWKERTSFQAAAHVLNWTKTRQPQEGGVGTSTTLEALSLTWEGSPPFVMSTGGGLFSFLVSSDSWWRYIAFFVVFYCRICPIFVYRTKIRPCLVVIFSQFGTSTLLVYFGVKISKQCFSVRRRVIVM